MARPWLSVGGVLLLGIFSSSAAFAETAPLAVDVADGRPIDVRVREATKSRDEAPYSCVTPCRLELAPGRYELRASARGMLTVQERVELPANGRSFVVHRGSRSGKVWGIILTSVGGAMLGAGLGMSAAIILSGPLDDSFNQYMLLQMGFMSAAGLAQVVPGVWMLSKHQSVMEERAPPPARTVLPTATVRF